MSGDGWAIAVLAGLVVAACAGPPADHAMSTIDATTEAPSSGTAASSDDSGREPTPAYTPAAEGIGPGPPCPADASCAASFSFDGAVYQQSCGALDPAEVDPEPLAVGDVDGQPLAVHALHGTDPAVVVAIRPLTCGPPLDLGPDRFHLAYQQEAAFDEDGLSDAYNEAMCRAALFGTDPAEGFRCDDLATPQG